MAISRAWALGVLMTLATSVAAHADPLGPTTGADAFINLGSGPYPASSYLASGNPAPWYDSPQVATLFGGTPTAQQIQSFDQAVLQDVQSTFQLSGISVCADRQSERPGPAHAQPRLERVEPRFPGCYRHDQRRRQRLQLHRPDRAGLAQSVNQLEWIVAHNISHELMLAFGVPENYDQTGNYMDARMANFAMMISPTSTFSPGAAQAISQRLAAGPHDAGARSRMATRSIAAEAGHPGAVHHPPLGVAAEAVAAGRAGGRVDDRPTPDRTPRRREVESPAENRAHPTLKGRAKIRSNRHMRGQAETSEARGLRHPEPGVPPP